MAGQALECCANDMFYPMPKRMGTHPTNLGTGLRAHSPLEGGYCHETTELVRRCTVESQVVAYVPALQRLGQVTYQCRSRPEGYWNIPHTRLGSCSQGGLVYAASTNSDCIAA
jgi:hypothetical protein